MNDRLIIHDDADKTPPASPGRHPLAPISGADFPRRSSPRLAKKQHISLLSASGWGGSCLLGTCTNPEHYEEVIDEQPIVQPLYQALDELNVQISSLRGEKELA